MTLGMSCSDAGDVLLVIYMRLVIHQAHRMPSWWHWGCPSDTGNVLVILGMLWWRWGVLGTLGMSYSDTGNVLFVVYMRLTECRSLKTRVLLSTQDRQHPSVYAG